MKGKQDHGAYSNVDHGAFVEAQKAKRNDPAESGVPGNDFARAKRAAKKSKRSGRRS